MPLPTLQDQTWLLTRRPPSPRHSLGPPAPAGTHDNQTAVGWWKQGAQVEEKALIRRYTGMTDDDVAYCFIREALKSCAQTAVVTMQVCGCGGRSVLLGL